MKKTILLVRYGIYNKDIGHGYRIFDAKKYILSFFENKKNGNQVVKCVDPNDCYQKEDDENSYGLNNNNEEIDVNISTKNKIKKLLDIEKIMTQKMNFILRKKAIQLHMEY